MKSFILFTIGFLLLVFPASAQVPQQKKGVAQNYVLYEITEHYNGKQYIFAVWANQLQKMPSWPKKLQNPPLPILRAIVLARCDLLSFLPIAAKWDCENVTWSPMGTLKWMYFVKFRPHYNYINGKQVSVTIIVLMDGTAIKPWFVVNRTHLINGLL